VSVFLREQAEDFFNAYKVLHANDEVLFARGSSSSQHVPGESVFGMHPTMGPAIVCLAFSVELHVKYLHYSVCRETPRGHNILDLFKSLPEEIQKGVFSHPSISQYGWSFSEFEGQISQISDGFEKWRYAHEAYSLRYNVYAALVLIEAMRFSADSVLLRAGAGK
jgi:hypothetical protein